MLGLHKYFSTVESPCTPCVLSTSTAYPGGSISLSIFSFPMVLS